MRELLEQLQTLRASGRSAVAATLIATSGPSPRRVGARLWVDEGGRSLGSVSVGGCIDDRVMEAAPSVIRSGEPTLLIVDMGDPALDLGFTCNGLLHVLLEPVDTEFLAFYDLADACSARGGRAVRFRRLDGGFQQLVICTNGSSRGTLGSTALDAAAREQSPRTIESATLTLRDAGKDVQVFAELLQPAPKLVVLGAGPVAPPLLRLANALGWETIVVDARSRVTERGTLSDARELRIEDPAAYASSIATPDRTAAVLLAHDYKYDLPILRALLQTEIVYIGMLGSRRRGKAMLEFLADQGVEAAQLARIRVPVGLDIGADSPAELALSVLAEALAALRGRAGCALKAGA